MNHSTQLGQQLAKVPVPKINEPVPSPSKNEIQEAMSRLMMRVEYCGELMKELERRLVPCLAEPTGPGTAMKAVEAESMFAGTLNVATMQVEMQIDQLNSLLTRLRL